MFHWIIRNRIMAAIKIQDLDTLKQWLSLTNDKIFDETCWQFMSDDGLSLPELSLQYSNDHLKQYISPSWYQTALSRRKHLYASQDYIKGITLCWQNINKQSIGYNIQLRWYHHVFHWLHQRMAKPWFFAKENRFSKTYLTQLFKQSFTNVEGNTPIITIENQPSLKETYTPHQTIDRMFIEKKRVTLDRLLEEKKDPTATLPSYWLKTISLTQQIDQLEQHQQQKTSIENTQISTNLQKEAEENTWIDNSMPLGYKDLLDTTLCSSDYNLCPTHEWLDNLKTQLFTTHSHSKKLAPTVSTSTTTFILHRTWDNDLQSYVHKGKPSHLDKLVFMVSTNAADVLLHAKGSVRAGDGVVSLNALPLGFFVDIENRNDNHLEIEKIITLKFSPDYRQYQLTHLKDSALRQDPYNLKSGISIDLFLQALKISRRNTSQVLKSIKQSITTQWERYGNLEHVINRFKQKNIELSTDQRAFLYKDNEKWLKLLSDTTHNKLIFNPVLYAIDLMIDKLDGNNLLKIITIFSNFHKRTYTDCFCKFKENLLETFIRYLAFIPDASEFNHLNRLKAMAHLLTLNDIELSWFNLLTSRSSPRFYFSDNYHPDFDEISRGLFYFINYFKAQNIPLPTTLEKVGEVSQYTPGLIRLKGVLDCISLSRNPILQAEHMATIPRNIPLATAQLRAGYCFVHEDMCLDDVLFIKNFDKAFPNNVNSDPYFITRQQLETLLFQKSDESKNKYSYMRATKFHKAILLRYLAFNTKDSDVVEGLNAWNKVITTRWDREQEEQLHHHWDALKKRVLSYPSKMAVVKEVIKDECFINENLKNRAHQQKLYQEDDLTRLVPEDKIDAFKLAINQMNSLKEVYSNYTEAELKQASNEMKEKLAYQTIDLINCLSILRELHYRQSGRQEWLRLEQVVVILIGLKKNSQGLPINSLYQIETGEGKTVIIQMIALLQALQGIKVDINTHNERLALDSYNALRPFAFLSNLSLCNKKNNFSDIADADILYVDISWAVINDQFNQFAPFSRPTRPTELVLIDEVDNVVIDIHANTTMQISTKVAEEADADMEVFLITLNTAIFDLIETLKKDSPADRLDIVAQRCFVQKRIKDLNYYKNHLQNDVLLDFWISAAYTRAHPTEGLIKNEDYVVETDSIHEDHIFKVIHIVHKDTTGRVDKLSQWGSGVHQCVAAWEKNQNNDAKVTIKIPALSQLLAEGNVVHYLDKFKSRSGFSASLGEPHVREKIKSLMQVQTTLQMPRAKRPLPNESIHWPKIIKDNKAALSTENVIEQYSRAYHFAHQILPDKASHFERLLEALRNGQDMGYSMIVFFNTIDECELFSIFLTENLLSQDKIQILDDLNPTEDASNLIDNRFHPTEATVIQRSKEIGMITLTTAAGSRGTDFSDIRVGILAKPSLERIIMQKKGRVARNTDLGVTYEIYCKSDLFQLTDNQSIVANSCRFFEWKKTKQLRELDNIDYRLDLRVYKKEMQDSYLQVIHTSGILSSEKQQLEAAWIEFFSNIDILWRIDESKNINLDKMSNYWYTCFANTVWSKTIDSNDTSTLDLMR